VMPGSAVTHPTAATSRAATAPAHNAAAGRAATDQASTDRATIAFPAPGRAAADGGAGRAGRPPVVVPRLAGGDLFSRHTRSYAAENSGQQITILQAGCTTAEELDTGPLRTAGARMCISLV